jgi:hypothetical protein
MKFKDRASFFSVSVRSPCMKSASILLKNDKYVLIQKLLFIFREIFGRSYCLSKVHLQVYISKLAILLYETQLS